MSEKRLEIKRIAGRKGNDTEDKEQKIREIFSGLTSSPKDISPWPKYLYDARGSELFEEITRQPEYYQTKTELSIIQSLHKRIGLGNSFGELVELGSGSSSKTRELIDPIVLKKEDARYTPLDVSESALMESTERLLEEYPSLRISGYVGDFDGAVGDFLMSLPESQEPRLIIFLGGTIGNFSVSNRVDFLKGVRKGMNREDRFLVGLDLVKDQSVLEAAYDDAAGVTAAFNKNVLEVLNQELNADFDQSLFSHRSVFDNENKRIEMWLDSEVDQEISIGALNSSINFQAGEGLRTEVSHKFTRESVEAMFEDSGLDLIDLYTDEKELFGLALAKPE